MSCKIYANCCCQKCFKKCEWQRQQGRRHAVQRKNYSQCNLNVVDVLYDAKLSSVMFLADNYFQSDKILSLQPILQYPVIVLIIALLLYYFIPKLFKVAWNYVVVPGAILFVMYVLFQNPAMFLEAVEGTVEFIVAHPISTSVVILVVLAFLLTPYVLIIALVYFLIAGTTLIKPLVEPFLPPVITQVEKSLDSARNQVSGFYNLLSPQSTGIFSNDKQQIQTDALNKQQKTKDEERESVIIQQNQKMDTESIVRDDNFRKTLQSFQKQGLRMIDESKKNLPIVKKQLYKQGYKIYQETQNNLPIVKKQAVELLKTVRQQTPGAVEKSKILIKKARQRGTQIINKGEKTIENISEQLIFKRKNQQLQFLEQQQQQFKEPNDNPQKTIQQPEIITSKESKSSLEGTQAPQGKHSIQEISQKQVFTQKASQKYSNMLDQEYTQEFIRRRIQDKFKKQIKKREQMVSGDQIVERILDNS